MAALASRFAAAWSRRKSSPSASSSRRCSFVVPVGPGAAPRRAVRTALRTVAIGSSMGCGGSAGVGVGMSYGWFGRKAGFVSSAEVVAVPGAVGSAVRAWLAADSSPRWASAVALAARAALVSWRLGAVGALAIAQDSASRVPHAPAWYKAARRSSSSGGIRVWPGSRRNGIRDAKRNSNHPRVSSARVLRWEMRGKHGMCLGFVLAPLGV